MYSDKRFYLFGIFRQITSDTNRMDTNTERASRLDTATLSDALDKCGIRGQCLGIQPRDHSFRMTGRAFTLKYGPADVKPGTVGDYIDELEEGTVCVLDNQGRMDATVWGDILTWLAHKKGLAGTVIDGVCRDVSLCLELGYPIYSRGYIMRTGKDRVQVDAANIPVNIGTCRVCPGDLLRGDADGVVVLPKDSEGQVLTTAESIQEAEDKIREMIAQGMSLSEAREKMQYHRLQTKEE